jgi:hypothetical protein
LRAGPAPLTLGPLGALSAGNIFEFITAMAGATRMQGYCNICNQLRPLTVDHVPPKGSTTLRQVDLKAFTDKFVETAKHPLKFIDADDTAKKGTPRSRISQNGMKFRSICAQCNNYILGGRYDLEIKRVSETVGRLINASFNNGVWLPDGIRLPVRTHHLVRGIVGHLLAALESPDPSKPMPGYDSGFYADLRAYVLDENLPIPPGITFYYWTYPRLEQVLFKGLGLCTQNGKHWLVGDLLKFFPLAYFVVDNTEGGLALPVTSIIGDGCNDMNCVVDLHIRFNDVPPHDWPETPDAEHYTIHPQRGAVVATPRRARRPRG